MWFARDCCPIAGFCQPRRRHRRPGASDTAFAYGPNFTTIPTFRSRAANQRFEIELHSVRSLLAISETGSSQQPHQFLFESSAAESRPSRAGIRTLSLARLYDLGCRCGIEIFARLLGCRFSRRDDADLLIAVHSPLLGYRRAVVITPPQNTCFLPFNMHNTRYRLPALKSEFPYSFALASPSTSRS